MKSIVLSVNSSPLLFQFVGIITRHDLTHENLHHVREQLKSSIPTSRSPLYRNV